MIFGLKNARIPLLILLAFLIAAAGCSTAQHEIEEESPVRVVTGGVKAWIDYMPGGPASFHCTGTVTLIADSVDKPVTAALDTITLYQNKKALLSFQPLFEPENDESSYLESGVMKVFRFNAPMELKAGEIDPEVSIRLELHFNSDGKRFDFVMNNIKIDKVY